MRNLAPFIALALLPACGSSGTPTPDASDVTTTSDTPDVADASPDASDVATAPDAAPDAPAVDASFIRDISYTPPDRSRVIEPGVRREAFLVTTPAAAPNPATDATTPDALNAVQVLRYRQDVTPPAPVRAVIIAVPGFLGGAGTFDTLARSLVKRGAAVSSGGVEVWAIDRRSNLLEDLRGMDAAEALGDPEVAKGYYLDRNVRLNGEMFAGFLSATDASYSYMAEWGLATLVNDLHAVIARVPSPRDHAILLGHSLGGGIAEAYQTWDFAGTPGYDTLAGTVLVDGALAGAPLTETEWHQGSNSGPGGMAAPGVDSVRTGGPYYFQLPLLGIQAEVLSEIGARRALLAPDAVVRDLFRDRLLKLLLGIPAAPPMTNAAAFGFALDNQSNPLAFAQMSLGNPGGGPLMSQPDPLGQGFTVQVPASTTDTYIWYDAPAESASEFTPIAAGANCWATSPSNFPEWYFPERLPIDIAAVGNADLHPWDWQVAQGILAEHAGAVDLPELAIGSYYYRAPTLFNAALGRLSPAVGAGRPNAGATRDDPRGFRVIVLPAMTHLDPLSGADGNPNNPVPEAVETFALTNTGAAVSIPAQ